MKFTHLADCHIGGWRDEKLKKLGIGAFKRAVGICITEQVNFVLIAGDLFDTALPSIDVLKDVVDSLKNLKDNGITTYIIAGSHDFSPSGKTMLDVLEKAGLCIQIQPDSNFTIDKTGAKIAGVYGLKGGLEKNTYTNLNREKLESEEGYKIFMFHTALDEFKPADMRIEGQPSTILPKNFDYYAGGHVHYIFDGRYDRGTLTYPGALFPNNFAEIEKFKHGGFYIIEDSKAKWFPIKLKEVVSINIHANEKSIAEIEKEINDSITTDVTDKIITLRIEGILKTGKPSDIDFKSISSRLEANGAYFFMKNTNKLLAKEFEALIEQGSVEDVEKNIIETYREEVDNTVDNTISNGFAIDENTTKALLGTMNKEKNEGEKNTDFENRILHDVIAVLKMKGIWDAIAKNKT